MVLVSYTDTFFSFCNYAANAFYKLFPDVVPIAPPLFLGGGGGGGKLLNFYD